MTRDKKEKEMRKLPGKPEQLSSRLNKMNRLRSNANGMVIL
jgi:hypothetical protein